MMDKDKQFIENARQVLDDSVRDLDAATLSKLARARNAALDEGLRKKRRRHRLLAWGSPAVGLAAAVLVGVMLLREPQVHTDQFVADLDILAGEESLEFYEEMEFYEWLAEGVEHEEISGDRGGNAAPVATRARYRARRDRGRAAKHGDAGVPRRV
ncbi:hypothetical protein [Pseudodesulfovibrio sp. zrk46]|uniref:hypothetical protein n=1 Tax=Pseudodesulfovibrio sp. zrk46 TaxID=2725288 RepID=UPI001448C4F2|nr:hypothetical protein [Pseudodesulfovibrio sp. zrk46]QJB56135.1 hypothetical protein HFN16_06790 [Pseudodesulfovibrio sp. zrk46]